MNSDRELLELAAKVVGYRLYWGDGKSYLFIDATEPPVVPWNPLTDDGDALRLAVKLGLPVEQWPDEDGQGPYAAIDLLIEHHNGDAYAATRRAIVRAAAEIGRAMP